MSVSQFNEKLDILKNVAQAMHYNSLQKQYKIMVGFLITILMIILASMIFQKWDFFLAALVAYVGSQIEVIKIKRLKGEIASKYIEKKQLSKLKEVSEKIIEDIKLFVSKESNGFDQNDEILKMLIRDRLSGLNSEIGAVIYLYSENKDKFEASGVVIA